MTEADLDTHVRQLLAELGLYGYHAHDNRRASAGWPDWVIVGDRMLFRELKSPRGVLSSQQTRVRNWLVWAGADWAVWRPRDLVSGRIETELMSIS